MLRLSSSQPLRAGFRSLFTQPRVTVYGRVHKAMRMASTRMSALKNNRRSRPLDSLNLAIRRMIQMHDCQVGVRVPTCSIPWTEFLRFAGDAPRRMSSLDCRPGTSVETDWVIRSAHKWSVRKIFSFSARESLQRTGIHTEHEDAQNGILPARRRNPIARRRHKENAATAAMAGIEKLVLCDAVVRLP